MSAATPASAVPVPLTSTAGQGLAPCSPAQAKGRAMLAAQAKGAEIITIGGPPSEGRVSLCAGFYRSARLGRLRQRSLFFP